MNRPSFAGRRRRVEPLEHHVSLSEPIGPGSDLTWGDVTPHHALNPEDALIRNEELQEIARKVNECFENLTPRQKEVVVVLHDGEDISLEEAGQKLGITRQAVHQIYKAALRRMRAKLQLN